MARLSQSKGDGLRLFLVNIVTQLCKHAGPLNEIYETSKGTLVLYMSYICGAYPMVALQVFANIDDVVLFAEPNDKEELAKAYMCLHVKT